jgi:MYXO-CTERM domain-containing protein
LVGAGANRSPSSALVLAAGVFAFAASRRRKRG